MMNRTSAAYDYNDVAGSASSAAKATSETSHTYASIEQSSFANEDEKTSEDAGEFDSVQQRRRRYMTFALPAPVANVRHVPEKSEVQEQPLQQQQQQFKECMSKADPEHIQLQRKPPRHQQYDQEKQQQQQEKRHQHQQLKNEVLEAGDEQIQQQRQGREQEHQQHQPQHQQADHQQQLPVCEHIWKTEYGQVQCQRHEPRQIYKQPQEQPENKSSAVIAAKGDGSSETRQENCLQVKSAVLDAQSFRVSVKSLVRKLSDTTSQNLYFKTHKEKMRQSQRPDTSLATYATMGLKNSTATTPQQMGALPVSHENKGVDTVGVVKGGVASLISKFQSQAQLSECTKVMLRKSGTTQGIELKSATSASCESTVSGIQSNMVGNLNCSTEVSKLSLRGDSEPAPAGELTFGHIVPSSAAHKKVLNSERTCPNLASWSSKHTGLGDSERLLGLRSFNAEGQTEVPMGVSGTVRSKIMQPANEKGAACLRGYSTNKNRILKDTEIDKYFRHSTSTLGNLKESARMRETFPAGDNCKQFNKQFASSESSFEDVIANENACERWTKVDNVGKVFCKKRSFSGMLHGAKDRLFLGISEVKGQEENVRGDCVEKDFEVRKYTLESEKNTLPVMSGWKHDDSQEAVRSDISVLNQAQQVCEHTKERMESPAGVARNCDSRKPDPSTASEDGVIKPLKPSTASEDDVIKPFKPSSASEDDMINPFKPSNASEDDVIKPFKPSTASEDDVIKTLKPSSAPEDGVIKSVKPSIASEDGVIKTLKPSIASEDGVIMTLKPSTRPEDGVIKSLEPGAASESVEDVPSSCSDVAICKEPQPSVEENLLVPTTVTPDTGSPVLSKEGNFNNHGKELSRLCNVLPSDKDTSHLRGNVKAFGDVAKQDMQVGATTYAPAATMECNQTQLDSVLKPEETDIIFCEDKNLALPEGLCHYPAVLPHKVRSLIVRPAGNDFIEKQPSVVLPGPVKVDATSTKSQQPPESKQVKAQVEKKFDVYSEQNRGSYLAKSLTGKYKWKNTAFSGRTEKIKVENQANKGESSKPVQQLGYNMLPGARREFLRKQIRKPIPDNIQHGDKNADVKSHRRNTETPTRPNSQGSSRQRYNVSLLDTSKGGVAAVFAGKQSFNILQRRNLKSAKINSPRGRTFGKYAFRNTIKTVGHETLHAGHNQGFRNYTSSSEPTRACQNTTKVSEGVPLQPFSSIDASPKRSRKSNNHERRNTSCWRNNAGRAGIAQTATGGFRALGASQTSIAPGGHGGPFSNFYIPTSSKISDDFAQCCKKPLLRPAAVKSDMSAGNPLKSRPIFIRRTGQGAKKWPLLSTPGEVSFTKMYRSGSPMVSLRVCEGNSNKSGIGSGPIPANYFLPRADLKQDAAHSAVNQTRCASTSEGIRRTKLSMVPANGRHDSSGRNQNQIPGVKGAHECTGLQTASKIVAAANPGLHKRMSPGARLDNKLSSRTDKVRRTMKHGHETVKTFHNYSSAYFATTNQISQSVTEEARQVKECCIMVSSIEEAEDVAHSLLSSAGVDFIPLKWDREKGCPQEEEEEECNCDRNESSDSEEITKGADGVDVYKANAGTSSLGKCYGSPLNKNRHSPHHVHRSPAVECDVCLDSVRAQSFSVSKLKHCRKPSASIGEINLLEPYCLAEDGSTSQITAPIPNVRRINIQPMICIPWSESIEHWRNTDNREQQKLFDQSLSVPEELITKMPSKHLNPDIIGENSLIPARISSQPVSQPRQRSVSTDASKDIHRNEVYRPFQQRILPQARSNTISGPLTGSQGYGLFLEKIKRKQSRGNVTDTEEWINNCQQAESESSHKTAYVREHSEATAHVDDHGGLPNADLKAKCSVNLKSPASTSSNDYCAQNEFSKQRTVECETGIGTSSRQNGVDTQLQAQRDVFNTDASHAECNVCIKRQVSCKAIWSHPVCRHHDHERYDIGMEKKGGNTECVDAVNVLTPKPFRNAESPTALSELLLPTTDYSDCRIPSSNNDHSEGYSERHVPGSNGLYFRENIIKPLQANCEAAWTRNGVMLDGNATETPHAYSVDAQYLTKTCTNEEEDSPCGCSYRKRRALSEGDRTNTVGRVVQLRNLYEQRHWNSQAFASPGIRYSREKLKAVVASSISEDACSEYSNELVSVSKASLGGTYNEDKLKDASKKQPEYVANEKTTNPPRLNLSAWQDSYGDKRNNEGVSQCMNHPGSCQGISRSVHNPISPEFESQSVHKPISPEFESQSVHKPISPEGESQSVHKPIFPEDESQSVHSLGNSQSIPQSVNIPGFFPRVIEPVDTSDNSQGISESVRSFGTSQGVPQSPPSLDQGQDLHLNQYQRNKVPLLAAKFSAASTRDLKRSATALCSRYRDNDAKHSFGRPSDERGKRESSLERMPMTSHGWKGASTRATTLAGIKGKKAGTDYPKIHQKQSTVDTSQRALKKEKSVNCHDLPQSQKKEIDDHSILHEQNYAKGMKAYVKSCTPRKMLYSFQQTGVNPNLSHTSGDVEETTSKQKPIFPDLANTCIEINSKGGSTSACSESAGVNKMSLQHWQYPKSGNDAVDGDIPPRFESNYDTRGKHNMMANTPVSCTRNVQRENTFTATELTNAVMNSDNISPKNDTDDETVSTLNQTAIYGGDSEVSESSIDMHISKLESASFSLDSLEACVDKSKQYPKNDLEYEKSQPTTEEMSTIKMENISTAQRENAELRTSPQKVFSQRHTRQRQNLPFDPKPPTGKTISREASREATKKPPGCAHPQEAALEISQRTPGRDTDSSDPTLDMELMCTAMDDSADSFNCLFIENVKYLKDVSGEGQNKSVRHDEAPGIMKRKGSFSKQAGLAAASRDKKDRGPASKDNDRTSVQAHGVGRSPTAVNPRPTKDSSVSPINVGHVVSHGKVGTASLLGESNDIYDSCAELTVSEADTLSLSNVSELQSAASASENSQRVSNIHQVTTKDVPSARHTAQVTTYDQSETGVCGKAAEDIQRSESGLTRYTGVDMEARRRRRQLEKAADVSAAESSNWRSKVYQKENTNTSNASSFPHKETPWTSYRTKETLSSIDNHTQEAHSLGEPRRRRSEDSNCGDLSERLARRRAKRLEEKRGSLSNDGSVDSQQDVERQWSRDSSVRSIDSFDVGDHDDRLSARWCKQHDEDVPSGRRGSRNTCDSLVFTGSTDNHEEVKDKLHKPQLPGTDSEGSNRKESKPASSEVGSRKWSSKDSNFYSAESTSSFRSYDDASSGTAAQLRHTSLGQESTERELVGHSKSRRRTPYQNWSEDSAFSEMKETLEDTLNANNNNDNSEIIHFEDVSIYPSLKRGNEDFGNDTGGSALGTFGSCVVSSSQSLVNEPPATGGFNDTESSQFSSREIEGTKSEVLSLSKLNSALLATSRDDGSGKVEDLTCWRGSFDVPSKSMVPCQTECQETVQVHAEEATSTNLPRETNEAVLSVQDQGDVSNENSASPQSRENKAARKRRTRKDKSALRKSVLNMAEVPAETEGNTQVQHDAGQSEERPRRRQEGSFVSQHASFWENTAPNIQNATPARQRANIPARYTGDKEKLTATRQKFMQNATATTETSSTPGPKPKIETNEDVAPKKIARSFTDFNQLLQKFSGSESNSEKSDAEIGSATVSGVPKRRSLVRRQEAKEIITSSEESDTRRTPDRTQSLKLPSRYEDLKSAGHSENNSILRTALPEATKVVEKSPSFHSEFMSRKFVGKSMDTSHKEKETSPLRTIEPSTAGVRHADAKVDHGVPATFSSQQNHPPHSKSLGFPVEPSDVQGQRQRLSALGDKHKDLKSTSSFQNTAFVHTEANTTKQADLSTTATVLMDKVKSQSSSNLGLMSKSNDPASSKKVASGHAYSTSSPDSNSEKQPATVHTTKQADSSITTTAKVSVDKEKSPNTSLDLASKHKVSVSGDKPASLHVASQSSSDIQHGICAAEVPITKQANISVTTAANVSMDKTKNPNRKLDLVSKHDESVRGDKAGSQHVSSQISSDSKNDIRAAEAHVTKQADTSITTATKVSVDKAKSLNTNLDLASKHKESQSSDKSPSSQTDSQSSSEIKRDIHVAEAHVSKQAATSLTTNAPLDKTKSPNTNMNVISKHNEPAISTTSPSPHIASMNTPENKDVLLSATGNVTKPSDSSSGKAMEKVSMGKVTSQNINLDLISKNNELVTSDNSVSGHVASASSSESKHKTAAAVDTNKSADPDVTTTATKLLEKTKSSNTNLDHESATSHISASQLVTSSSSPERKPDLHPPTGVFIASSIATDASQHREPPVAKPRSSTERESKPQASITNMSVTSAQSADFTSTSSNSPVLTSSVSSSVLHSSSVSSDMTPSTGEVRRASSFKEATVTRTESMERRKGILKRNTSLNKHDTPEAGGSSSSFPVLDPQLAKILMQRKQMLGDGDVIDEAEEKKDEVHELARRARPLSAAEEIEENLRYSLQKAAQRGVNPEEDEGLKRISVADRVYSMQSKIEEEKYAALTPKSRSGLSTPRSRPRSGFMTPTNQKSFDESIQQQQQQQSQPPSMTTSVTAAASTATTVSAGNEAATQPEEQPGRSSTAVSGPQLMEKLSELASATERYQEKRHRFQHRARSDWRYQTQPVTYEEIQAADRMESVSAFRALVRKQTSINAFEQINAESSRVTKQLLSQVGKMMEFPQHLIPPLRHARRGRMLRHRTLPVTAEELNAVPEHQMLVTNPDWLKLDQEEIYDSKADSGILSGSDAESLNHGDSLRSLTTETDLSDADPSRMSVTDKTSMFRVLEEKTKAERDKEKSASGAKRYINRKKRERSQTMPITEEEVKSASEMGIAGGGIITGGKTELISAPQPEVVNRSRSSSISDDAGKEAVKDDDELTKLSLSEKVRLFSKPREPDKQPAKVEAPVVKRRNRKVASRFNTQPVTNEEVEKAAASTRISPLAMSLVKPPDTEILKGLPLKDQRELMALHAGMFLSQNSFRSRSGSSASQSQPSSRRPSINLEEGEAKNTEKEDWSEKGDKRGILKDKSASAKDLHDTKSILKTEPSKAKSESEVHSILKVEVKHIVETTPGISEPRGILKKTRSEDMSGLEGGEDIKGILKHIDSEDEECQGRPRSRSNSQPLGILKMEGFSQASEHSTEIKSILKAPSQESMHDSQMIKSAMRRGSMESDISVPTATSSLKSALRSRNRSSLETDDIQTPGADVKIVSQDGDLNSNNSQRHVGLSIQSSEVTIDHFSSSTYTKVSSAASSTTTKSSSNVDNRTFANTSSSVTTCIASASSLQVPEALEDKSGQSASDDGESSSGEILDGTPRRTKLKRKSRFSDKSAQGERYKTQPPELTDSTSSASTPADTPARRKYKYEGRHRTQPITPDEMREAEATTPASDLIRTPGGSIADRLNQLKTSGEEEWKKRVGRKEEILATPEVIKLREKPGLSDHRPTSIADRLNELETSKTTWKERVEESDAKQFTVAARLAQGSTDSPLVNKLKNLPRKDESGSRGNTPLSSPVTPTKDFIAKIPLPKDIVQDTSVDVEGLKAAASSNKKKEEDDDEKREPVTVEVPDMGEEVENFFAVKRIEEIKDRVEMHEDDFNNLFIEAEMILSSFQKPSPKRKTKSSSRNPLKTMSTKLEIRQEYTEVFHGTAEKELKRVKKEGLAKEAGFAQAALAGLASTENFKQVELRRTDSGSSVHGQAHDPFKEPMLLHVKGRRSVQMRLVEPHTRSVNEGDCYVLVTSDKIIYWEGHFANVIEKAKASEVASYILQKKDLGCKKATEVLTVHQLKDHLGSGKQFWAALEGEKEVQECGPDAEDELYENSIVKCNMVYRLEGNALLPYQEYWGAIPRHEMLKKNEVIVFDFGTEFYVWQGKAVSMEQRRLGMKLSKQLYEKGYNYTESPLNPISPLRSEDSGGLPLTSPTRPSWAIFGKVNQNMETILFREKFADWPDSSRLIGYRGHAASDILNRDLLELTPFDAKKMIPINTAPVSLKLEGANVGRGVKWSEDMQGFVKEQDIITLDVIVWYVLEFEHYKLPALSHGQFHDGDTYVVRWQYMIANANMRSLKGSAARNSLTGRERCAYFFWQGNESTINEKGASALMTVELDEERGPQIRVLQGKEPPCFLNLFDGKMIVHIGKREEPLTNSQGSWRLYCLRGDYENEVYLQEIPVSVEHLRSRSSIVLLNVKTGIVYVWHGAKSPKHVRELSLKAVNKLKENTPLEVRLHDNATITEVIEVEEGKEKREIWSALGQQDRAVYNSLLQDPKPYSHTIRLFHMSSVSLVFEVQEQLNPARVHDLTTPFPFLQSDLYKVAQPALFLIDNEFEVYLWQGWWPIGSEDTENVHTGSAIARFNLDRRLAMETTLHYCKEKNPRSPPTAYLVCAGVEPVCFTSLFPFWEEDSVVKEIAAEERKTPGYTEKVSEILLRLTQTRYTLAELQVKPLPEGVDPLRLETYLQDADFEEILDMSREDFYSHPHWKQIEMKKHVGLF